MRGSILAAAPVAAAIAIACGGTSNTGGFNGSGGDGGGGSLDGGGDASLTGGDDGGQSFGEGGLDASHDSAPPPEVALVYAHSPSVLYQLDPKTKTATVVGPFTGGCADVIDIAIDGAKNAYATTFSAFYKVDLKTAACTHVSDGTYPNSLSFVPKGTLDPNAEALVGYFGSQYVRIDTTSGAVTNVGSLGQGYASSGDIVSVINGGTFLTVNGSGCGDCLLQVNPKTGDVIQNYGSVNHASVFGIAFWAGVVYGFDDAGQVFSITWKNNAITTTDIPVPNPPPGLQFWGAGSTTAAPPSGDDGGIPIK